MYNEELKQRYISEKENTTSTPEGYLLRQFNKTEEFEKRYGKDVCCFTTYEIMDMYKTLNIVSLDSLIVLNNHLSLYTQWSLYQNLVQDSQNHYAMISKEELTKCVNTTILQKTIVTRKTVEQWASQLVNPSDSFVLLALFEGIKGQEYCEIANLKITDFDGNMVKLCTGRQLNVSDKLVEYAIASSKAEFYYAMTGHANKRVPFMYDNLIIKKYPNCKSDTGSFFAGRRIYTKIYRCFDMLGVGKWMKPNSLIESGKIDAIKAKAKELGITSLELLNNNPELVKDIEYRYEYGIIRNKAKFIKKYQDFL